MKAAFQRAMETTALASPDPYQITIRLDSIYHDCLPMLEALAEDETFPKDWVEAASTMLLYAATELEKSQDRVQGE